MAESPNNANKKPLSLFPSKDIEEVDDSALLPNEKVTFSHLFDDSVNSKTNNEIDVKYIKGDVRIVTEQARYPLTAIVGMVEGYDYELNPEFQRRRRWDDLKKSRLIESFIINVPIPPIFLYEDRFSHYEVMDGLQRLTTIHEFYNDLFKLEGLEEWPELNGRTYSDLPEKIKRGIDRRYLSSIILLQETAKNEYEAQRLKQLVFERINSGGVKLANQETRNAIYNGPLNQLCIKLSRNLLYCQMIGIPELDKQETIEGIEPDNPQGNAVYDSMTDVEMVLRFFAYRQILCHRWPRLKDYLDNFLNYGNRLPEEVLKEFESLFENTINLLYEIFGKKAFWLWRPRKGVWGWFGRLAMTVYEPMLYVFSKHTDKSESILEHSQDFRENIKEFYQRNYEQFGGASTTNLSKIRERNQLFEKFLLQTIE